MTCNETIFSKIIRREVPAKIVYETDDLLAFRDINPQAPTHILLIPKRIIPSLNHLSEEDVPLMGKLLLAAKEIASQEGLDKTGYRVVVNNGNDAGQAVAHLHLHILGGRELGWPPG